MASYLKMLLVFFLLTMARSYCDDDKVKLSLYYEALCPYCSDFIVNQLSRALYQLNLVSIVDLKLVPWGNTQLAPNNAWICQHGPDECSIDIVEACAIDLLPQHGIRFKLIECIERLNLEGRHGEWKSCMNSLKINQKPIMDCYQSRKGFDLELRFADETNHLNPPHRFVPWVLVNNNPLQEDYQNFVAYICKAYRGQNKLKACEQHVLETNSYKEANSIERLALNLFKCGENEGEEYLKQESMRNFKTAFRAFYEIFPYGRFAHFTANSAILEAVPFHVDLVHIVDFDLCEGSQWPPVIEAIAHMKKSLIITSIKLDQDQDSQFEQTKRHLCNFARSFSLNLKVQEMEMAQIVKNMEGNKLESEFMAFNCMVGLPHMGRTRNTSQVMYFIKVAKAALDINEGILTFGDGEECEKLRTFTDFSSFFDKNLERYKALYESIEWGLPSYLNEARMAMETLFVSPLISSESWLQKWAEGRENMVSLKDIGLKGRPLSKESLNEVRELVKEVESPYGIRIEGGNWNEMVLEWNGTPLVRVSTWM